MKSIISFTIALAGLFAVPAVANAIDCSELGITSTLYPETTINYDPNRPSLYIKIDNLDNTRRYRVVAKGSILNSSILDISDWRNGGDSVFFVFTRDWIKGSSIEPETFSIRLEEDRAGINEICTLPPITITPITDSCELNLTLSKTADQCYIIAKASNIKNNGVIVNDGTIYFRTDLFGQDQAPITNGSAQTTIGPVKVGMHRVYADIGLISEPGYACEFKAVRVGPDCTGTFSNVLEDNENLPIGEIIGVDICKNVSINKEKCVACSGTDGKAGIWTGLGCIRAGTSGFTQDLFKVAIGLGGGIAFLMLIYGAFLMVTSAGDPKATDNAKGIITGAISGLLVIIFSAVILQIVGIEILQIPGFAP